MGIATKKRQFTKVFRQSKPFAIQMKLRSLSRYVTDVTTTYFDPRQAPSSVVTHLNALVTSAYAEITHIDHVTYIEDRVDQVVNQFWKWSDRKILSVKEIAQQLGKSCSTVYRWIKQGKLQAQKYKGRWQVIA